jgi:hypothetical protein
MRTSFFNYKGKTLAILLNPMTNQVKVYVNGRLYVHGSEKFLKTYLMKLRAYVDRNEG